MPWILALAWHAGPRSLDSRATTGCAALHRRARDQVVAIRYFAGACPRDLAFVFGISHAEVFKCVWFIVDAVNTCHLSNVS